VLQFEAASGDFEFTDTRLRKRKGSRMIKPLLVLKDGFRPGGRGSRRVADLFDFDKKN
jgi:hypothetical protein